MSEPLTIQALHDIFEEIWKRDQELSKAQARQAQVIHQLNQEYDLSKLPESIQIYLNVGIDNGGPIPIGPNLASWVKEEMEKVKR